MDDNRFIDTKKFREWIKRCKCIERYEWYKRDLRRKRPNRKKGRDLYHGILTYRRRVGQHEGRLSFRGVAEMYDKLRIKVIRQHPELAEKIPDLYIRFLSLRFPPHEFEAQLYAKPKPLTESIMDRFYHDLKDMRVKVSPIMAGELARTFDGKDAVLARVKEVEPTDAVVSFALAMLRDEEKSSNK
jgi:hypothetical protein